MTQEQETDVQAALADFRRKFYSTNLNDLGDELVYNVSPWSNGYPLEEAQRVIKENNLNLKATLSGVGLFKNNRLTIEPK